MTLEIDSGKPLVLLIPGLDGTGLMYTRHLNALSRRYRPRPWWFRNRPHFDYADLATELAEGSAEEPPGSIIVVGESFGGTVAMHYVLAHPERIRRLVLINTFAYYPKRIRIRTGRLLAPLLQVRAFQGIKNFVVNHVLVREGIAVDGLEEYRNVIRQVDLAAYERRLELVERVDLRDRLPEIRVPTILLASGRDKIVPSISEANRMAARIPKAAIHTYPRAGHALLLTPGFELADVI